MQTTEQQRQLWRQTKMMELRTMKAPATVSTKKFSLHGQWVRRSTSNKISVSVSGKESRDNLPTSTKAAQSGSCEKNEKAYTISNTAQKSKRETRDFVKLSIQSKCSNCSQKKQQSGGRCLKQQQQLKLPLQFKRIKFHLECSSVTGRERTVPTSGGEKATSWVWRWTQ